LRMNLLMASTSRVVTPLLFGVTIHTECWWLWGLRPPPMTLIVLTPATQVKTCPCRLLAVQISVVAHSQYHSETLLLHFWSVLKSRSIILEGENDQTCGLLYATAFGKLFKDYVLEGNNNINANTLTYMPWSFFTSLFSC
jgi:hypothetical protein